jgi:predicted nucleotidyltransferase
MVDKNGVARAVKAELQQLYGDRLAKVILYGSYARGDFRDDSDMDFLVVLKDDSIDIGKELRLMNKPLYKISDNYDIALSSHPTTLSRLKNSQFLFYENIRREGVEV